MKNRVVIIGAIGLFGFLAVFGAESPLFKKLAARDIEKYL
jgi:hypothetical protein